MRPQPTTPAVFPARAAQRSRDRTRSDSKSASEKLGQHCGARNETCMSPLTKLQRDTRHPIS
jgi:hypothetical protein